MGLLVREKMVADQMLALKVELDFGVHWNVVEVVVQVIHLAPSNLWIMLESEANHQGECGLNSFHY